MFDQLNRITTPGDSMTVTYSRADDNSVRLVLQPALADDAESLTDEDARNARAALCRPLLLRGTHAEVEQAFNRYIAENADTRIGLRDAYDTLTADTKTAASKAVQAAADKKAKSDAGKKKPDTKATETPAQTAPAETAAPAEPTQPASNPTSLF